MVPPFDHEWIIAGQATAGLEILDQCVDVAAVVVPVGGGGLVSGVAAAVKLTRPNVKVVGVEPAGAAKMKASVDAGHVVTLPSTASIADGLMPVRPGDLTFAHVQAFVDAVVTVEDPAIAAAVLWIFANAKIVSEPSGAATTAAVLGGVVDAAVKIDGPIVAIVSGGNMFTCFAFGRIVADTSWDVSPRNFIVTALIAACFWIVFLVSLWRMRARILVVPRK